ncbi:hypothetical protein STFE110948_01415 [Streptobacillus felis]|uniref:Uncharacterized protein n=1 Tax=Streptobacillus felis TaxID=1384509 RepID=A0A7Z0PGD7_9FUSO|nr:hypothetical protein [Streptobacillus felis]NYV28218.1 hypothetical protein [Streptobacillus felis]
MLNKIVKIEDIFEVLYDNLYIKNEELILNNEKIFNTIFEDKSLKLKKLAKIKFEMKKYFYNLQFIKIKKSFDNENKNMTYNVDTLSRLEITKATNELNKENMFDYKNIIIHSDVLSNLQNHLICEKGCPLNSSKVEEELRMKIIINNDITINEKNEYISYVMSDKIFAINVELENVENDESATTKIKYYFEVIDKNNIIRIVTNN